MKAATDAGQVIAGRYVLETPVGRGGMGEVWRARHVVLHSSVAIKFLYGASASQESTRKRFLKEAQVTARLKTRHAVGVFDYGVTDEGLPFLVMELLEGETLDERIERLGRIPANVTVGLLKQAARALDRAHALGIVHRDFKPENIVILRDEEGHDEVKILDFGVAKLVGELEPGHDGNDESLVGRSPLTTFTRTGSIVGTPYYMAPEQIKQPDCVGPRADIWALGVVAYECVTGRRAFEGETVAGVLKSIIEHTYARASEVEPLVPALFDDWFETACAVLPEARFPDAATAIVALSVALDEPMQRGSISRISAADPPRSRPAVKSAEGALAQTMEASQSEVTVPPAEVADATPQAVVSIVERRSARRRRTSLLAGAVLAVCGIGGLAVGFLRHAPESGSLPIADRGPGSVVGGTNLDHPVATATPEPRGGDDGAPPSEPHSTPPAKVATGPAADSHHAPAPVEKRRSGSPYDGSPPAPSAAASGASASPPKPADAPPTTLASAQPNSPVTAPPASPYKLPDLGL